MLHSGNPLILSQFVEWKFTNDEKYVFTEVNKYSYQNIGDKASNIQNYYGKNLRMHR